MTCFLNRLSMAMKGFLKHESHVCKHSTDLTMIPISLGGSQRGRACSLSMELKGIVHKCNTAASTPPISSLARPLHNQLDMHHHMDEQITGLPCLRRMSVRRFVGGASVTWAVGCVCGCLDGWLSCYPLPGKSRHKEADPVHPSKRELL